MSSSTLRLALVGNPNCGKTALFNLLTGARQKVANYAGVTVERRSGVFVDGNGRLCEILDLPGSYSLHANSEDEAIARDAVLGGLRGERQPDLMLAVLDATHLHLGLRLVLELKALGRPMVVILNCIDAARARGMVIDAEALSRELDCPVVSTVAITRGGAEQLLAALPAFAPAAQSLLKLTGQSVESLYQEVDRILARVLTDPGRYPVWQDRLDRVVMHPILGVALLATVMLLMFQAVFAWAAPLMEGLTFAVDWLAATTTGMMAAGPLRSLLVDGLFAGVGSVLVFLPQILILFLFIGILEDSGYLARAALIADRTMAKVGLQGKSFIPLLSAYACAVPAIMATRTIENKRDRIATILIAPFMTCSARLPVYILIIAAFIPDRPLVGRLLSTQAGALFGLYILGFLAAAFTARALKSSILKSDRTPFVMELPPYRRPTLRSLGLRLLDRAKVFLRRAGTVILVVAIGLWILAHVPLDHGKAPQIRDSLAGTVGRVVEPVIRPLGFNWKIGIGLITSLAAREVIVGTLGTIYGIENADEESMGLREALRRDLAPGGAAALLIFFAFAMQCMSTVAVVKRETGGWKWPAVQFGYMTGLAYVCAWAANVAVTRWLA